MTRESSESVVDHFENVIVHLDATNGNLIERKRGEDVSTTACANNEYSGIGPDVVDQIGNIILQVFELVQISIEFREDGARGSIDGHTQLSHLSIGGSFSTHAPSKRNLVSSGVAINNDARESIPFFVQMWRFEPPFHPRKPKQRCLVMNKDCMYSDKGRTRGDPNDSDPFQSLQTLAGGERDRSHAGKTSYDDHRCGPVYEIQQPYKQGASQGCPSHIDRIQLADRLWKPCKD